MTPLIKTLLFLGAAIALLRSTTSLLSPKNHYKYDQYTFTSTPQPPNFLEIALTPNLATVDSSLLIDTAPLPKWGITYIPYTSDPLCKTAAQITEDIATIASKNFTSVRLYSTDCAALENLTPAALEHNLNLILGIHIDDPNLQNAQAQIDDIIDWAGEKYADGKWDMISLIVIGNEAIFNDYTTPSSLSSFLINARAQLREAGYTGPITTTEPISVIAENAALLCPAMDIPAANIHPFFHVEISAEDAGLYVLQQLSELETLCPASSSTSRATSLKLLHNAGIKGTPWPSAINLETGWPRRGSANGRAVPGVEEQKIAVEGILRYSQGRSVVMGFGDDEWKDEGEFGVEGSWGCEGVFGGDAE